MTTYAVATPLYSEIPLFAGLMIALGFGAVVGLLCSPIVIFCLFSRDQRIGKPIVLSCSGVVAGVAAWLLPEARLFEMMGVAAFGFAASCVAARTFLPKHHGPPGLCRRCGYDVRASLQFKRCPECGTSIDESPTNTQAPTVDRVAWPWPKRIVRLLIQWPTIPLVVFVLTRTGSFQIQDSVRAYRERVFANWLSGAVTSGHTFKLSEGTNFTWESVYIFGPYATGSTITKSTGIPSPHLERRIGYVKEGEYLAVFVRNREVVEWLRLVGYGKYPFEFDYPRLGKPIRYGDASFRLVKTSDEAWQIVLEHP